MPIYSGGLGVLAGDILKEASDQALGMVGIWSEIYVLVVPSLSPRTIPLGWVEILVTAGFLGAFWLCSFPGLKLAAAAAMEPIGESH